MTTHTRPSIIFPCAAIPFSGRVKKLKPFFREEPTARSSMPQKNQNSGNTLATFSSTGQIKLMRYTIERFTKHLPLGPGHFAPKNQKSGIKMEQITENNSNHMTMYISGYYNSTNCAKTGTFCSHRGRICSAGGTSTISSLAYLQINQFTLISITCPAFAGLSHYPITALPI